jgi:hypothetical protein
MRWPCCTFQKHLCYLFLLETESTPGPECARMDEVYRYKCKDLVETRTRDTKSRNSVYVIKSPNRMNMNADVRKSKVQCRPSTFCLM